MKQTFHYFEREAAPDCPAGWTVSKRETLPDGDFRVTEFIWGCLPLWFVDADEFSAAEREAAWAGFVEEAHAP